MLTMMGRISSEDRLMMVSTCCTFIEEFHCGLLCGLQSGLVNAPDGPLPVDLAHTLQLLQDLLQLLRGVDLEAYDGGIHK